MDITNTNTGVRHQPIWGEDFMAGANSPIILEPRNTTLNWLPFCGTPEKQSFPWGDTMGCVSFSAVHHCAAPQLNWALANNLLPKAALDFFTHNGYIIDGTSFNLSERFTVVKSDTSLDGNSAQNVLQAIRKFGIVPEGACPNTLPASREAYFTVSSEAIRLGQESLKYISWGWQGILEPTKYLVQAPIMGFLPVCPGWGSDDPVKGCTQPMQHAIGIFQPSDPNIHILDTYAPFTKQLAPNYPIPALFQLVMYVVPAGLPAPKPRYTFNVDLKLGDRGQDILHLQDLLGVEKTGIYDNNTRAAVFGFQLNHLASTFRETVLNLWGRRVGPATRAALNKI